MKIHAVMLASVLCFAISSCALFTKQNAETALDVMKVACIIAHVESSDATVAQVCGIADILIPDMKRILEETKASNAKALAAHAKACKPEGDAGK